MLLQITWKVNSEVQNVSVEPYKLFWQDKQGMLRENSHMG